MFVWPEVEVDFVPGVKANFDDSGNSYYFVFDGKEILRNYSSDGKWLPVKDLQSLVGGDPSQSHYMGQMSGVDCYVIEMTLASGDKVGLRGLFGKVSNFMFSLAGRALQILDWHRSHQYCGKCGSPAEVHEKDRAMICRECNIHSYPRLSPSIITLVYRDDQVLLARNHNFPSAMYSTLAGFVEPGESIEETVNREVLEEVGVTVGKLEYLGSQPWPFPNSLMLGFLAEYKAGDIVCQEAEIADAQWFDIDNLPKIPGKVAISRWIIDTHLSRKGISS